MLSYYVCVCKTQKIGKRCGWYRSTGKLNDIMIHESRHSQLLINMGKENVSFILGFYQQGTHFQIVNRNFRIRGFDICGMNLLSQVLRNTLNSI